MTVLLTILAVIIIFSVLVLIHEYGHFIAARRSGIKVLEFGIGFPPKLWSKKMGETEYSINAIPFGGFVRLFGEDASSAEIIKSKRSFAHQTPWVRTKVVVAGVFMNFVLAIALLTIGFSFGIEPLLVTEKDLFAHLAAGNVESAPGIFVSKTTEKSESLGLSKLDQILAIDDAPLPMPINSPFFKKGKLKKTLIFSFVRKEDRRKNSTFLSWEKKNILALISSLILNFRGLPFLK
jgi:membrane-associated protease RseP (regulator of RpoE activity)